MSQSTPSFDPAEYKRRVNLLLNELNDMGLDVMPAAEDDWAEFIAVTKAGIEFNIGLDPNGLNIQNLSDFDLPENIDLQNLANVMNIETKVCKVLALGSRVSLNAFYPLIPSSEDNEFSIFMTYILDDIDFCVDCVLKNHSE